MSRPRLAPHNQGEVCNPLDRERSSAAVANQHGSPQSLGGTAGSQQILTDSNGSPRDKLLATARSLQMDEGDESYHDGQQQSDHPPTKSGTKAASKRASPFASLSLQAIIVIACGIFAFVTSFVSFYLQYDFFLNEYSTQMEGRIEYYSEMFGNQVNVKSNSNASSIAHVATTAVFDAYDGMLTTNPSLADPRTFQWYLIQTYTMFAPGTTVRFTYPSSGMTLTATSSSATVDICSDVSGGFGVFMKLTWVINETLTPWFPVTAPTPCTDGRLDADVATIVANASAFVVPRLGTSIPFDHFLYSGVSVNTTSGAALFVMSVIMKPAAVVEWGSEAPNVDAYYFDDNARFVGTSRGDIPVDASTTIADVHIGYIQTVIVPRLQAVGFLTPDAESLRGRFFEFEYSGFAWGYHELPIPTLSGRPWRIVLVDSTHTDLTGSGPIRTGALLIAGGTAVALILCAVIFHVWFAPLSDLAARVRSSSGVTGSSHMMMHQLDAQDAAKQDEDEHILRKPMAFTVFTEIARAQEAYLNVQESLQEIQSYIPQSLQHHPGDAAEGVSAPMVILDHMDNNNEGPRSTDQAEEMREQQPPQDGAGNAMGVAALETTHLAPAAALPNMPDVSPVSRPASAHPHSRPGSAAHHNPNALGFVGDHSAVGNMLPCRMTTLHLRLHRFAKWNLVVPFLEMAATCICQHNGVLDTVDYGSITATFNCHRPCPTHERNAVDAALEIQRAARKDAKYKNIMEESPFSIGIDTDIAVALTVGFEDIKARVVIGPGFELARKLSTLAYDIVNADILVTGPVAVATLSTPSLIVDYIQPRRDHIQMLSVGAGGVPREGTSPGDGKSVHEVVGMNAINQASTQHHLGVSNHLRAPSRQSDNLSTATMTIELGGGCQASLEAYRIAFASMREGNYDDAAARFAVLIEQLDEILADFSAEGRKRRCSQSQSQSQLGAEDGGAVQLFSAGHRVSRSSSAAAAAASSGALLDNEVQTAMLKQARRLWNICSNRKTSSAAGGNDRYVRPERCPWDVLPVERELCNDIGENGLPSFLFQQSNGTSGTTSTNGGGMVGRGGAHRLGGESLATGSAAPDPTLIGGGNASFGTEWSRSQM